MSNPWLITLENWNKVLASLIQDFVLYGTTEEQGILDYQMLSGETVGTVVYNTPRPTTPLKTFFTPVKENVVKTPEDLSPRIILGVPSCDLSALDLLDAIYLEEPYVDPYYRQKRENTILIGTDCHSRLETCHCTTYGGQPYPVKNHDLSISISGEKVFLSVNSDKGTGFLDKISVNGAFRQCEESEMEDVIRERNNLSAELKEANSSLPDAAMTGGLIKSTGKEIWVKYASTCVSCGACATICPTCTCFLLVDRPEFEKVRQMDACQYPAFERVAAGEDPLSNNWVRFRNRYMCKYVWKPSRYDTQACTGCGRCTEACIGAIDKNELFVEVCQIIA